MRIQLKQCAANLLGSRLRLKQISQRTVATELGISQSQTSNLLNGNAPFEIEQLLRLLIWAELTLADVFPECHNLTTEFANKLRQKPEALELELYAFLRKFSQQYDARKE